MTQISRWKIFLILSVCLYGFAFCSPNFISALSAPEMENSWLPHKTVNLGLDLRGGAHLLYEIDMEGVFDKRSAALEEDYKTFMKEQKISHRGVKSKGSKVTIELENEIDGDAVKTHIRKSDPRLYVETASDGTTINVTMDESYIKEVKDQTIAQVIEVVRRRIDEMGTTEPAIQRQGDKRIVIQVPGVDSQQIRDLVGKTAALGFHLLPDPGRKNRLDKTLKFLDDENREITIKRTPAITGDMLDNAQPGFDQSGQAVVTFRLNGLGARKFCDITRKNTGKPFAIVLDNEVVSAPRINEPICGGNGQISGDFDVEAANNFALLLRAGALPADLTVVEERTVGPSLGADSVAAGKIASIIGLALVLVFMFISYGLFGLMANVALVVNVALLLALLSSLQATLTLPGIAGIVLTVGMAVDANVLIFERIREEVALGRTAMSSVDAGYSRAMSTIVDSNLTTLIAAMILFSFGTGPIKGFAVTLGLGIATSFFSAIMVTRLLVVLWLRKTKPKTLPI